jgi:hypothetical protein
MIAGTHAPEHSERNRLSPALTNQRSRNASRALSIGLSR